MQKMMSIQDIVKKDIATNYANLTFEQGMKIFLAAIMRGTKYYRVGNTLFLIDGKENNTVIYHSINGDSLKKYLYNRMAFYGYLQKQNFNKAITYFSSPKTLKLATKIKLPNEEILQSNNPQKGKFIFITNLTKGGV